MAKNKLSEIVSKHLYSREAAEARALLWDLYMQ